MAFIAALMAFLLGGRTSKAEFKLEAGGAFFLLLLLLFALFFFASCVISRFFLRFCARSAGGALSGFFCLDIAAAFLATVLACCFCTSFSTSMCEALSDVAIPRRAFNLAARLAAAVPAERSAFETLLTGFAASFLRALMSSSKRRKRRGRQ